MKRKVIQITINLNGKDEKFTIQGDNNLQTNGLAVSCAITYGNGAISPTAQITIYGLPIDTMNKLFRAQWNTMQALMNTIKIEIGELGDKTLTTAYNGNITFATVNMDGAPDPSLVITSQMAVVEKMRVTQPTIIPKDKDIDVADICKQLATESGFSFENYGVSHILTATTLNGSNIEKIQLLSRMCNFDLYIETGLIVICKKNGAREIKIPLITSKNGNLIGYPKPDQRGISLSCFYDVNIKFGGILRVSDSVIEVCNGDWRIYGLVATLEANIPNGKWQVDVNATWRDSKDAAVQRK